MRSIAIRPHGVPIAGPNLVAHTEILRSITASDGTASVIWGPEERSAPATLEGLVRQQLELIGENPSRDGLLRTPARVAASLAWLTQGYQMTAADAISEGVFGGEGDQMVLVRDIEFYSMCEHHMLPFFGRVHIAYIPDGRIIGLSKLPRVVEVFARRLQVQERLTEQIAQALTDELRPRGVAVAVDASHLCMMMRGVQQQNSRTVTSALRGKFRDCAATREEFFRRTQRAI